MLISTGGGSPAGAAVVEKRRTVVVFDRTSGKIIHMHHSVTFAGGASLSDRDLQNRALKLARDNLTRNGKPIPKAISAIDVNPAELVPGVPYRVSNGRLLSGIHGKSNRTKSVAGKKRAVKTMTTRSMKR